MTDIEARLRATYTRQEYAMPSSVAQPLFGRVPLVSKQYLRNPDGPEAAETIAALREALEAIQWRSDDKDNMEFASRITYVQMNAIRAAIAKAKGDAV